MPGAGDRTQRVTHLNANWRPADDGADDGADGRFELMLITEDGERHSLPASPASVTAVVAMAEADTVLAWDPDNSTLIVANIVGRMPWTVTPDAR